MPIRLALAILALAQLVAASAQAQQFDVAGSARSTIVEQTNAYRRQKGLPALSQSTRANQVGQAYATYLARTNKAGHRADGRSPRERLSEAGVEVCKVWENFHQSWTRPGPATVNEAMTKAMRFWKKSKRHEASLRSAATEIGVGAAGWKHGDRWTYTAIQMFIDPSCR